MRSAPVQASLKPLPPAALPGTMPTQGEVGELTRAPSVRVEFCIARDPERLRRVIEHGIRPGHPWEIPAIFIDESQLPLP